MPIMAKNSATSDIPLPEEGTFRAVCCAVWDLGNQRSEFNGKEKIQHKVLVAFELDQTIQADGEYKGQPYMLTRRYTLSLHEKANLRKDLEAWRGKKFTPDELANGFDLERLYGITCLVGVAHVDKKDGSGKYATITAILPLSKGMEKMQPHRASTDLPPQWVLDKMSQAVESDLKTEVEIDF